jgi:hypothetical protein
VARLLPRRTAAPGDRDGVSTGQPAPADPATHDSGVAQLQAAIDRSLARATPLTRRIFGHDAWTADQVQRFVNRTMTATIASVRPDGRPHAAWVLAACCRGTLYFSVTKGSILLANLRRRGQVALTVTDPVHGVIAEGRARLEGQAQDVPDLVRELDAAVIRGRLLPPGWDGYVYSLEVERIFAN